MDGALGSKPQVWFEVEKIIGVSTDEGNNRCYKVQWAPAWVSSFHLAGCENLIQEFLQQKTQMEAPGEETNSTMSLPIENSINGPDLEMRNALTIPKVDVEKSAVIPHVSDTCSELVSPDHVVYVLPNDESIADLQNNSHGDLENNTHSESRTLNEQTDRNNVKNDLCAKAEGINFDDSLKCPKMTNTSSLSFIINNDPAHPWNRNGSSKDITSNESFHSSSCETGISPSVKDLHERTYLNNPTFSTPLKSSISNHDMMMNKHNTMNSYMDGRVGGGGLKFRCPSCNITTATKQKMKEHARVHTGHRPYRCIVCDKLFKRKQDLKRHSNIHTGLKPHKCPACDRGFCDKSNLNQHIKLCTLMRTLP